MWPAILIARAYWTEQVFKATEAPLVAALACGPSGDRDDAEFGRILHRIHVWLLTLDICRAIRHLDVRGDPADELIAATSVVHNVSLVTRDRRMLRSRRVPLAR